MQRARKTYRKSGKKIAFAHAIASIPSLKKNYPRFPQNKFKTQNAEQQYRLLGQFD